MKKLRVPSLSSICLLLAVFPAIAQAQTVGGQPIPAPASADRIQPVRPLSLPQDGPTQSVVPSQGGTDLNVPANARSIRINLREVQVEGVSVFTRKQIEASYAQYVGHEITLDTLWVIAERITRLYRDNGYFLSRAYVPAQEVDKGRLKIRVVEGYVGAIENQNEGKSKNYKNGITDKLESDILNHKPLNAKDLEEFVLRMNDLPGRRYQTVLKPLPNSPEGAVALVLVSSERKGTGIVTADNFSSRFLGPYTGSASYRDSFIRGQETGVTFGTSVPTDELRYLAMDHLIPVSPKGAIELSGTHVKAMPGYTLQPLEIESKSTNLRVGYRYKMLRQWDQNLTLGVGLVHHNVDGDIMNSTLTRDRIRVLEGKINYDASDRWNGFNTVNVNLRRGLEILGSSKENDLNLSRGQAVPDFTSLGVDMMHQHGLGKGFIGTARIAGQLASDPLFSAEEFGYGGQNFGRAYDPSEIIGDQGVSGSIELAYAGLKPSRLGNTSLSTTPFVFYDIGKVWNKDIGSVPESGSSAGMGVRLNHSSGLSGQIGLAQPLTRAVDTPLNGGNGKNPRILLQINYGF